MDGDARMRWGLGGLVTFEAIVAGATLSAGSYDYMAMALVGGAVLAYALWVSFRGGRPAPLVWGLVAAVALLRAVWQVRSGQFPLGVLPTFLVPLGFALLALGVRGASQRQGLVGLMLVGVARTWFVAWYFLNGNAAIASANLAAAAGVWLWASATTRQVHDEDALPTSRSPL